MSAPLLSSSLSTASENNNTGEVRHRTRVSTRVSFNNHFENNLEHQNQYQFQSQQARRILDRSGTLNQSRGRWGVERRDSRGDDRTRDICCCRKIYQDFGKDWFFWLAYKKTFVLFLLLFFSYSLIIGFFGFIYLVRISSWRAILKIKVIVYFRVLLVLLTTCQSCLGIIHFW